MPEGRGSLSGRNGHGRWQTCQLCRLRILYVPVHGAKGTYRSAGPLAADAARAVETVKGKIESEPLEREKLNTKAVGIQGAKESLQAKMKKLENDEARLKTGYRPEATPKSSATLPETPQPKALMPPAPIDLTKKATKRENGVPAEKAEAEGWVLVNP